MTDQQKRALGKANNIRTWRAQTRKAVKAGNLELACELVLGADERLGGKPPQRPGVSVGEFLTWLPGIAYAESPVAMDMMLGAFRWPTEKTLAREVVSLDIATSLRLVAEIRARFQMDEVAA